MRSEPSDWQAPAGLQGTPERAGPLAAVVALPGSKSLTNRYLVIAALAGGTSRLRAPLRSRDTVLMADALRALGTGIEDATATAGSDNASGVDWIVTPATLRGGASIDCGLAGTVMRFLPPIAALADGEVAFDGDPHARVRPMGPALGALRDLGVDVVDDGRGALPFVIRGLGRVRGHDVTLDASTSSQFVSGLLLAGSRFDDGLTVRHVGPPVPSEPHLAMTVETLRDAGAVVDDEDRDTWRVEPGELSALDVHVEPDLSNAAPFLAAALVVGGSVTVPGWPQHTSQAGDAVRDILTTMGGRADLDRHGLTVHGTGAVHGLDLDLHDASELTPVVAALAAQADSPSTIRGVGHIRGHETDRLAALTRELTRLGADVQETDDGLHIRPNPLHGGRFETYADHRMVMAGAVLGLATRPDDPVLVADPGTVAKTLPDFTDRWQAMLDQRGGQHDGQRVG